MEIISDREAIRRILIGTNKAYDRPRTPHFACYLGAGASAEAEIPTAGQICESIREDLLKRDHLDKDSLNKNERRKIKVWENETLHWEDHALRYATCVNEAYPTPRAREQYFRNLFWGKTPSFCHYALALLTSRRFLRPTSLTTNFDKLIENAFVRQGIGDCQPIRTDLEAAQFSGDDRYFILKLHGDYDTNNIRNVESETVMIDDLFKERAKDTLKDGGLVVLGVAGFEKSIHTFFDGLAADAEKEKNILEHGLYWGVYLGASKPLDMDDDDIEKMLRREIKIGNVVSPQILSMMERVNSHQHSFCFFPIWGAGNFFFDLVKAADDANPSEDLLKSAEPYFDRVIRLRHTFSERAGLSQEAIEKHISNLDGKRTISETKPQIPPKEVYTASAINSSVKIHVLYGDLSNEHFMESKFRKDATGNIKRLAVVSPEDTLITAGGGLAEILLNKAGQQQSLTEMMKFPPIPQSSVAVTSAGNLPVHYIFHAAATKVNLDATLIVTEESIEDTTYNILDQARALNVMAIWLPLMGAGSGSILYEQSFRSSLTVIRKWEAANGGELTLYVFIFKDDHLSKPDIQKCLSDVLEPNFKIEETPKNP